MSLVKPVTRKTFKIRPSGRSSDFISPSFGFGCLLECSYCYMKRHKPKGLDYATNVNQILDEINAHAMFAVVDKPNQTDPVYVTYDIACNEDFAFHSKFYDWENIFEFFVEHQKAKGTFATKWIPDEFLSFNPKEKMRIRFSLMPQAIATRLEPNTPDIVDRIKATKAKHVLLIADSCFSGTLMRSGTNPDVNEAIDKKYIERLKSKKTRLVITSGGNEPVVDSDGGDHSLFALKLIDTLKNNNTVINSQMLFENIRRYVISNADQTPERALVHKTGHDGGDFLFFPKK